MLGIAIMIALCVIAVALIAIIVLMIISLVKKKSVQASAPTPAPAPGPEVPLPMGETAFAGEYTIQLSDMRHPGQKWKLPITGEIVIGRDPDCTLVLTDSRVSRNHCKISVGRDGLLVTNLSETNETKQNGLRISGDAPLRAGDILKLGHDELRVEFIKSQSGFDSYEPASRSSSDRYAQRPSGDETRHFF